jgi:hypothetical protein
MMQTLAPSPSDKYIVSAHIVETWTGEAWDGRLLMVKKVKPDRHLLNRYSGN